MENKLEELLNKLIEKGWKPFGFYDRMYLSDESSYQYHKVEGIRSYFFVKGNGVGNHFTLRQLVSRESGLRQYVCENGMIKEQYKHERILDPTFGEGWADCKEQAHDGDYGYRLMESALRDESELEQFLLENINF